MKVLALSCLFFFPGGLLWSQAESFLQAIRQDSATDIYLSQDWKNMEKHKADKAYQPALIRCLSHHQDSLVLHAKVRTRGHMRLNICAFPPLKLKLDKDDLARFRLSPLNEMDIVHHCFESEQHDQLLLREYLAYKLWELVSPYYFKTQLIRLHYINDDGTQAHETAYAFFVEHAEELAEHVSGRECKSKIIASSAIEPMPFLRTCLFEFMIGNTDWYIPTRHNLEFVVIPGNNLLVTVPFDFDYSGLVDASYAIPHESLKMSSVMIRYYQGWCQSEEEVKSQLQVFYNQKEKILELPYHIPGLNEKSIRHCVDYLQGFFEIIENPKKLENQIIRHCDLWPAPN